MCEIHKTLCMNLQGTWRVGGWGGRQGGERRGGKKEEKKVIIAGNWREGSWGGGGGVWQASPQGGKRKDIINSFLQGCAD